MNFSKQKFKQFLKMQRHFGFATALLLFPNLFLRGQATLLPSPDHIVVVIEENRAYQQIIGDRVNAPYINQLADSGALFTQSYALSYPSQPNYLMLYSGSAQNITTDNYPAGIPFNTRNMGACLIAKGKTFTGYAEGLPSVGFLGVAYGNYASKHAVYSYWQGTGENHIPAADNQPFTSFPANFSNLPTVSYVTPDLMDDMHSGTILQGDTWLHNNMDAYIQWAKTHNSLCILTFDQDDNLHSNHIATIFLGQKVKKGVYTETINHYNILRTIEDIYGICYDANDSTAAAITNCWVNPSAANELQSPDFNFQVYPDPSDGRFTVYSLQATLNKNCNLEIYNLFGEIVLKQTLDIPTAIGKETINLDVPNGIYFLRVSTPPEQTESGGKHFTRKIIIQH
jgi:acid phosphatase